MKYSFLLALFFIIAFSSCEKSTLEDPEPTDPETEKTAELEFSIKNLRSNDDNIDPEGYGEYNLLGYGYDVTGKYSHKTSVKEPVINTPSFVEENAGRFDALRVLSSSFRAVYATDAQDFTKRLTGEPTDIGYFKGNITHPFPDTDPSSDQYIYGLYDSYIRYQRLSLYGRHDLLTSYLTENFKTDSELLEPEELIKKYGTHVLLSLYTGAKLSLDYQAEYTGNDRRKAVENSFRAGLDKCFGLFSGFLDPADSAAFKGVNDPTIVFEAIGGDPSKIMLDETSSKNPIVNIADWAESISEENARFVYLNGLENLIPISKLILDADKKLAVEAFINAYIKSNEIKVGK